MCCCVFTGAPVVLRAVAAMVSTPIKRRKHGWCAATANSGNLEAGIGKLSFNEGVTIIQHPQPVLTERDKELAAHEAFNNRGKWCCMSEQRFSAKGDSLGFFAVEPIPSNCLLLEYVGRLTQVSSKDTKHKAHAAVAASFSADSYLLIDPKVDGNDAMWIRRSNNNNCCLKAIMSPSGIRLGVWTHKCILPGDPITLPDGVLFAQLPFSLPELPVSQQVVRLREVISLRNREFADIDTWCASVESQLSFLQHKINLLLSDKIFK